MRKCYLLLLAVAFYIPVHAQVNMTFTVMVQQERHAISPYIYGINNGVYKKATWRRWGGNRTSAYNWENNYSNAGHDYFNNNDDYIPWSMNLPSAQYLVPGSPLKAFHDSSLVQNAMSAITLPMVGSVSRDGAGEVFLTELAPSPRWRQVANVKGSAFTLTPDTTDNFVYVDEEMNTLIDQFGLSNTATGIKAYIMDNEPGLWCSQFPDMRDGNNDCVTYNELLTKSVSLATTIKGMDSNALVFGPESYGFNEYWELQDATDAGNYSADHWFIDSYLKHMKQASDNAGRRLLDVFSVHWYPDVNVGGIYSDDTTLARRLERMQCTRTLWDSTYTSNSWIGQWFSSELPIIPRLRSSINQFFPGTKFCIDEYAYGAPGHISGGIAQTEALGAFGKMSVDYAAIWMEVTDYVRSAFDLYRDYDGNGSTFGNISVKTLSSNSPGEAGIFASVSDTTNREAHIIVTNKSETNSVFGTFVVQGNVNYNKVMDYSFKANDMTISDTTLPVGAINGNVFTYTLPPLSVHHFVVSDTNLLAVKNITTANTLQLSVSPNPASGKVHITYTDLKAKGSITITDITGRVVNSYKDLPNKGYIDVNDLTSGIYFIKCTDGTNSQTQKLLITK